MEVWKHNLCVCGYISESDPIQSELSLSDYNHAEHLQITLKLIFYLLNVKQLHLIPCKFSFSDITSRSSAPAGGWPALRTSRSCVIDRLHQLQSVFIRPEGEHTHCPVTFPSWASLMACPADVVRRRLFPPNVLRPLIRLVRPTGPWGAPPGAGPATVPGAWGPTVRPSSSVTKKVDHILDDD